MKYRRQLRHKEVGGRRGEGRERLTAIHGTEKEPRHPALPAEARPLGTAMLASCLAGCWASRTAPWLRSTEPSGVVLVLSCQPLFCRSHAPREGRVTVPIL